MHKEMSHTLCLLHRRLGPSQLVRMQKLLPFMLGVSLLVTPLVVLEPSGYFWIINLLEIHPSSAVLCLLLALLVGPALTLLLFFLVSQVLGGVRVFLAVIIGFPLVDTRGSWLFIGCRRGWSRDFAVGRGGRPLDTRRVTSFGLVGRCLWTLDGLEAESGCGSQKSKIASELNRFSSG